MRLIRKAHAPGAARSPVHPWATAQPGPPQSARRVARTHEPQRIAQPGVQRPAAGAAGALTGGNAYLLDSHDLLWWWFDPDRLSDAVRHDD